MALSERLASRVRGVYFGPNASASNLTEHLSGVTWRQATTRVESLNTIALLVYHMDYYVDAVLGVFEGGPLEAKDSLSFDAPRIRSQQEWEELLKQFWTHAERFAAVVAQMSDAELWADFWANKHGDRYSNVDGLIEHNYYHLGQIVLIKKLLRGDPHVEDLDPR